MNKNLDGSPITDEQLMALALDAGGSIATRARAAPALHNPNLIRSELLSATAGLRFSLFCAGFLTLDTRL